MKVKDFINRFSQNNEMYIENRNNIEMRYRFRPDTIIKYGTVMDWMLPFTTLADLEVICIKDVIRLEKVGGITLKVDTEEEEFTFLKDLVSLDNCPLWLYNRVHNKNIHGTDA